MKFVSDVWVGRSPNGVLWMLKGRILYQRIGGRHQFMLKRRYAPRGKCFGFGKKEKAKFMLVDGQHRFAAARRRKK